jgi:hypothetical protein
VRIVLALALLLSSGAAWAQQGGMPDLRALSGRPLPVPELSSGTVRVRVSKQIPINFVPGVEVTAIVAAPSGEARKRTAKTDAEGYATFEGLATGSTFAGEATVDGERMQTQKFPIPAQGGTRVMLIAGLPKGGPPQEEGGGGGQGFSLGVVAGTVAPLDGTPPGTIELILLDIDGRPIPNIPVQLGQAKSDNSVAVLRGTADAEGIVRFRDLPTGEGTGYAAVIAHQGLRLGTEAFRLPADKGVRGQIRALGRTADPSVLRVDGRSKIIFEVGEDSVQVMQQLVLANTSDKIFTPGPEGVLVPLADGFSGARAFEGGAPIDVKDGEGVTFKTPVPPTRGAMAASEVRVGFVVPASGSSSVDIHQPLPFGMRSPLILIPAATRLGVNGSGVRKLPDQKDSQGSVVNLYELDEIAPGGALQLTVTGLPALDRRARTVVGFLCLGLMAAAILGSRRPKEVARAAASAEKLTERREQLFADLVAVERERKREPGKSNGTLETRRKDLVGKLEGIYRELSRLEHGESPAS